MKIPKYIKNIFIVIAIVVLSIIGYYDVENSTENVNTNAVIEEQPEAVPDISAKPDADNLIDINNATIEELDTLPEIGPKKAAAIVEVRKEMYGFKTVNDLFCVDGIGEKTLEKIRDKIYVREYIPEP